MQYCKYFVPQPGVPTIVIGRTRSYGKTVGAEGKMRSTYASRDEINTVPPNAGDGNQENVCLREKKKILNRI